MDYRVSWSPTALDDVDSIAEYINRDSPVYTRAVVNKILDIARKLEAFPNAGRIVPELSDEEIREHYDGNAEQSTRTDQECAQTG